MTYRVVLEQRNGKRQTLGEYETRKAAHIRVDQYRLDDEGHDEYGRLWVEDGERVIYEHKSTNYIVDSLSDDERLSGRILTLGE